MKKRILELLILAVFVTIMQLVMVGGAAVALEGVRPQFIKHLVVDLLHVEKDLTVDDDLVVIDDASIGGDEDVSGAVTSAGRMQASTLLNIQPQSMVTVTDNCTLTIAGSWTVISSAASVGITNIVGMSSGDLVGVENVGNYTVTITETGGIVDNGGNVVLPPSHTFWVGVYDGTKIRGWIDKDN